MVSERTVLRAYGWIFALAGAVFLAAPIPLHRLLGLPLETAAPGMWLVLTASLMTAIAVLALGLAREPGNALAWRALLSAKAVSAFLFVELAVARRDAAFLVPAAVDGAIFVHLWVLRNLAAEHEPPLAPRHGGRQGRFHEAWFARINDPRTGAAFWLRWWLERGASATASCRLISYRAGSAPARSSLSRPMAELGANGHFSLGACSLGDGVATGHLPGASWSLRWTEEDMPRFSFVPAPLGALGLAGSEYVSAPALARFSGRIETADGASYDLSDAPGMIGHSWGKRMAKTWRWAHAVFPSASGTPTVFEVLSARVSVLGWTSPWLTSANLWHDGKCYSCGGLSDAFAAKTERQGSAWAFAVALKGARASGTFSLDPEATAGVELEAPDGSLRACLNTKIGAGRLRLELPGEPPLELECAGTAAVEFVDPA
jgi:hypothetical protein